jgi:hypothetical protein
MTMNEAEAQKVICVIGMHRSGTSCLVGSLQNAGLELGEHHTQNRYNKRGNRENPEIVAFNDSLLAANGADWERPPENFSYTQAQVSEARSIAAKFVGERNWGFKDPRSLLVLPLWKEALPGLRLIGIFRHPGAVAESLQIRHGSRMTRQMAFDIWYHYNIKMYQQFSESAFPLLNFDWNIEHFHEKLNRAIVSFGLSALGTEDRFYTSALRNNSTEEADDIPDKLIDLYRRLNEITL